MHIKVQTTDELKALSHLTGDLREVTLSAGRYYLTEPLIFENRNRLSIHAEDDAVIIGGYPAQTAWEQISENIYRAPLTSPDRVDGLVVGGVSYHMARYPHADESAGILQGTRADCLAFAKRSAHPAGGYLHALHCHMWGGVHYEITGVEADGSLALRGGWQNNRPMGMHEEYRFIENILEALGAPGEFFHDADAGALYVCSEHMPPSDIEVITNPYLLHFEHCDDIELKGLHFEHSARTFMAPYEPLLRSDWCIHRAGAVFFDGGSGARVHSCTFSNIGSNALFFSGSASASQVISCHFSHLHASAICFVGRPESVRSPQYDVDLPHSATIDDIHGLGPKENCYVRDCVVDDCLIHDIGKTEKQVAGIEISMAARITVRHVTVYNCPRAAFNIGDGTFGGHVIEYCDAFNTVLETGDHGGFNGWGRDRYWRQDDMNTEALKTLALRDAVQPNYIRNNRFRCDHGWDIDLDDGCSNYIIDGNLCLNGGIKLREGFERTVRNNICVSNTVHVHVWYASSGDIIENNILFKPYDPIGMPDVWGKRVDGNILHEKGANRTCPSQALQAASGQDRHSVLLDARFACMEKGDVRVLNDEARMIGFKQPPTAYGVVSSALRARALACPLPTEA